MKTKHLTFLDSLSIGHYSADPIGNAEGAPGLFLDAQFGAYLDNFVMTKND